MIPFDANNPRPFKEWFDELVNKYNVPGFIENDPVTIPHKFSLKEDIEISGFFCCYFGLGQQANHNSEKQ